MAAGVERRLFAALPAHVNQQRVFQRALQLTTEETRACEAATDVSRLGERRSMRSGFRSVARLGGVAGRAHLRRRVREVEVPVPSYVNMRVGSADDSETWHGDTLPDFSSHIVSAAPAGQVVPLPLQPWSEAVPLNCSR